MNIELSIIIPVYNVAQYLRHCLQSILDQQLASYEVILVDDGSYDNSLGICIEWCNEHKEFKVFRHEQNRGLSEARNTGISQAIGRYITFVDSDDFLAPETLGNCMASIGDAEVIEYPVMINHLSDDVQLWQPENATKDFETWMKDNGFTHCYACNKVFKHELWDDIKFPKDKYYEDIFTIPYVLKKAHKIVSTDKGIYYYCKRNGSITNTPKKNALHDYLEALIQLFNFEENLQNTSLYIQCLNAQTSFLKYGGEGKIVPRKQIPWSYLFHSSLTARQRIKALWYKFSYHG